MLAFTLVFTLSSKLKGFYLRRSMFKYQPDTIQNIYFSTDLQKVFTLLSAMHYFHQGFFVSLLYEPIKYDISCCIT